MEGTKLALLSLLENILMTLDKIMLGLAINYQHHYTLSDLMFIDPTLLTSIFILHIAPFIDTVIRYASSLCFKTIEHAE